MTILWCMHCRAQDEVHPAPDYETALKWADAVFERFDVPTIKAGDENMPLIRAVPAPWPWDAKSHTDGLAQSIADWTPRAKPVA